MNSIPKDYNCDGQMNIFDFLETKEPEEQKIVVGQWIENHGKRVFFKDIEVNKPYIMDYSTYSHRTYKVVFIKNKTDNDLKFVDDERGIKGKWSWGNSYSCLTRQMYVDAEPNMQAGESREHGWFFELPEKEKICEYSQFDYMHESIPNFDTMSIKDAADRIGEKLGLEFKESYRYGDENENAVEYTAKNKKLKIDIYFSHYVDTVNDGRRFLSVDITNARHEGFSSPCESIEEAIEVISWKMKVLNRTKSTTDHR